MSFQLGKASLRELATVHPDLQQVVRRAIVLSAVDFTVYDGARTEAEQRENVRRGVSKTMKSNHLVKADGWGHAVDLVPWVDGRPEWKWPLIYEIAPAMRRAADEYGVRLRWGGVWDKRLDAYPCGNAKEAEEAVREYCARHPGPDFIDGPHFELVGS